MNNHLYLREWLLRFSLCNSAVLDNMSAARANRLQKLKIRAGRVIAQKDYNTQSYEVREKLSWKTLHETRNQHKLILLYKALNGLSPPYLLDYFNFCNYSKRYNLRDRKNNIGLPRPKTKCLKNSFVYTAGKLWNSLPKQARLAKDLKFFIDQVSSFSFTQQ